MLRRLLPVVTIVLIVAAVGLGATPAAAGGGGHGFCADGMTDVATNEITTDGACFAPTVARIEPGETVTFTNTDTTTHAVGGVAGSFGKTDQQLAVGDSVSFAFKEEGVYPYICVFHPGMAGAIVVGDGEGDSAVAAAGTLVPPTAPEGAGADTREAVDRANSGNDSWLVPVGVALAVGLLGIAAIPRRRRNRGGLIATKL